MFRLYNAAVRERNFKNLWPTIIIEVLKGRQSVVSEIRVWVSKKDRGMSWDLQTIVGRPNNVSRHYCYLIADKRLIYHKTILFYKPGFVLTYGLTALENNNWLTLLLRCVFLKGWKSQRFVYVSLAVSRWFHHNLRTNLIKTGTVLVNGWKGEYISYWKRLTRLSKK